MLTIIKCEMCGKELVEGDAYTVAGKWIVPVAPCGCRSTVVDNCSECEDLEANKLKIAELTEQRDQAQRELKELQTKLAAHEAIP